jgi:hypothetical protein
MEELGMIGAMVLAPQKKKVLLRRSWQHQEKEGDTYRIRRQQGNGRTRRNGGGCWQNHDHQEWKLRAIAKSTRSESEEHQE